EPTAREEGRRCERRRRWAERREGPPGPPRCPSAEDPAPRSQRSAREGGRRRGAPTAREEGNVNRSPLVLGIETSCDETGAGLVRGHELLADSVASSVAEHARFGGGGPEGARRAHLEALVATLDPGLALAGGQPA